VTPPERGYLSRTGHIGGAYMPVDTVENLASGIPIDDDDDIVDLEGPIVVDVE
jgi:hypothetical protein